MNRTKLFYSISFFLISIVGFSQKEMSPFVFEEKFNKAEELLLDKKYNLASPILQTLDSVKPNNANVNYKLGICYFYSTSQENYDNALKSFEIASSKITENYKGSYYKEESAPSKAYYFLGKLYHIHEKFDEAINAFNNYKSLLTEKDIEIIKEVDKLIILSKNAKEFVNNPIKVEFENLGSAINTEFSEYSPVISADESTLIFTSRRKGTGGELNYDGLYYEDIYISNKIDGKWTNAVSIDSSINTNGHDACLSLSNDGRKLFLYKYEKENGDIYESNLIGDKWTEPIKLGEAINSKAKETHACISPDYNWLFFSSDREGGFGGKDIYIAKKLPTGQWGECQNLGSVINTELDETVPYIHTDGTTLYFASQGHNSIGGFDLFKSEYDGEKWSEPVHLGYPISTPSNDYFFVPTADGKSAYFATPFKHNDFGSYDICKLTFPDEKETALRVVVGYLRVNGDDNVLNDAVIHITDIDSKKLLGEYRPNKKSGKFLFILENGKAYNLTASMADYFMHSENIIVPNDGSFSELKLNIELKEINKGEVVKIQRLDYNATSKSFTKETLIQLNNLENTLKNNSSVVVKLSTLEMETRKSCFELTQKVGDYLIENGVNKEQLIIDTKNDCPNKLKSGIANFSLDIEISEIKE